MKKKLFRLSLFSRYKKEIDERNYYGLQTFGWLYAAMFFVELIILLIRKEPVNWFFGFFILLDVLSMILLRKLFGRVEDITRLLSYLFYFFIYGVIFYSEFSYPGELFIPAYAVASIGFGIFILSEPIVVIITEALGAGIVSLGEFLSTGELPELEASRIMIVCLIAMLSGLLIGYMRIENLIFETEANDFSRSEDEAFVANISDSAWQGRNKYGILSGEKATTRRVFSFVFSISSGKLLRIRDFNIFGLKEGMEWGEVRDRIMSKTLNQESRMKVSRLFDLDTLRQMGNVGKKRTSAMVSFDVEDGQIIWTDIEVIIKEHPITGDYIAKVVVEDITEDRILMAVLNRIVESNYDNITCVENRHNRTIRFEVKPGEEITGKYNDQYDTIVDKYIRHRLMERDMERARELFDKEKIREALVAGKEYAFLLDERGEDGKNRKKMFKFAYLDPGFNFFCVLKQDVTEVIEKESEAKKRVARALEERETAMNARDDFMTKMSHEMRTPMNAILGLSTLMEDEINNPKAMRDYIKKVQYSGNFLLRLISDVLDMTKMEQETFKLEHVPYSFADFWEAIDTMIGPMCVQKEVDFEWKASVPGDKFIYTDPVRITQVFINLLSNAVKYTPKGGHVVFECRERAIDELHTRISFSVKDDGIGMSREFIGHLFEPFAQESKDVNSNLNGTGLGLPIVKGIVEAMGGKISVKSEKGEGTTFKVVCDFEVAKEGHSKAKTSKLKDLTGKRILIVEDNDINREIAVALIEKKGMIAETATNGQEAIEQFASHTPDYYTLILMDIRMPIMSGLTATKRIRAMEREDAKSIPIIAMTANAFLKDVQASRDAGLNEHLSKPIDPKKLYETISNFIR